MRLNTAPRLLLFLAAGFSATCGPRSAPPAAEAPSLDVTSWTEKSELFMEYPPLVAAQTVRFAVHLTRLGDFSAVNAGRPHIEMTPESGGSAVRLAGSEPLRPGAFRVEGTLPSPGRYRWALVVDAPGLSDRHDLGVATVFGDQQAAVADAEKRPDEDAAAIAYLKEQQWTNPFATTLVRDAAMRTSVRVPAFIEPLTGGEAIVATPAAGRFASGTLPSVGDRVRAGQELGRLEPRLSSAGGDRPTLQAAAEEARVGLESARVELTRAERLLNERVIPARRVEDAKRAVTVAETRQRAADARLAQLDETLRTGGGTASGNSFALRAPIAGRVAEVFAALGAAYDEGAPLFRIVRTDRVELQAHVQPADAASIRGIKGLAFEVPGRSEPIALEPDHVHDAGIIDPKTHALPVQIEVANPGGQLLIGQTGTAVIYTGEVQQMPTVPASAVLSEAGRAYVFVQSGGERFDRRFVETAGRDGDMVGVKSGLKPGDRVVIKGAYEIQLASAAKGLPAEGHVH
jgi:cobalt-zinc-cadmium efflux system membrane fusion protein